MEENPLAGLGELSKPATVLVEKISDAVGGIFKPYQIIRVAKAEAEAERIRAESQIQITDLQRRAFYRFLNEEARKQQNIEDITRKALPDLNEKATPEKLDDDWIANFFDRCRLVSDEDMQQLWSRVLAGEANTPGTYSKRTVRFLSGLDKSEAELFTTVCGFGCVIGNVVPLIYDVQGEIYNRQGINFGVLSHLETIGLIQFGEIAGFRRLRLPKKFSVWYYGETVVLEIPAETDNSIDIGKVLLTKVGQELAPICGSKPVEGFLEYVQNKWRSLGYIKNQKLAAHESALPAPVPSSD